MGIKPTFQKTDQIDGRLDSDLGKDPCAIIKAHLYRFQPLPGNKRRSDITLNHKQLMSKVYEIEGMTVKSTATAIDSSVQMGLF